MRIRPLVSLAVCAFIGHKPRYFQIGPEGKAGQTFRICTRCDTVSSQTSTGYSWLPAHTVIPPERPWRATG